MATVGATALADLNIANGLQHLTDRAANDFWAAEQAIMAAEEQLQQRPITGEHGS